MQILAGKLRYQKMVLKVPSDAKKSSDLKAKNLLEVNGFHPKNSLVDISVNAQLPPED